VDYPERRTSCAVTPRPGLELDRVVDASPDELDSHRLGLTTARQNRLELIGRSTARLLTQMDETARKADSKVLLNPFDSPAAVKSSNQVTTGVLDFRGRLGIESGHQAKDAKRWGQAAAEVRSKVLAAASEGANAAERFGAETFDRTTEVFRPVDIDGIPDQPRAAAAAEEAGAAIKAPQPGSLARSGRCSSARQRPPWLAPTSSPSRTNTERPGHIDSAHARAPMRSLAQSPAGSVVVSRNLRPAACPPELLAG
jgi:hypothetical protein